MAESRFLDEVRAAIRTKHYSIRTEAPYACAAPASAPAMGHPPLTNIFRSDFSPLTAAKTNLVLFDSYRIRESPPCL